MNKQPDLQQQILKWYQSQVFKQCPWRKRAVLKPKRLNSILDTLTKWELPLEETYLVINVNRAWPTSKKPRKAHPNQKYAQKIGHVGGKSAYT